MAPRYALIVGAGPAGLTAAYELLSRSEIVPIVLEQSDVIGGISRTARYKGNRIDIGGHRFFSKSDAVMAWWQRMLPVEAQTEAERVVSYQNKSRAIATSPDGPSPEATDAVMLVRERKSRIYHMRKFFEYPVRLDPETLLKLGPVKTLRIGFSYMRSLAFPLRDERTLEDFFINRFGRELYQTFFKSYSEKVWGRPCDQISAEWGAQRVKGLSVGKAIRHFLSRLVPRPAAGDLAQKGTETSLIERFLYPKLGPGQMWETVAERVVERGGQIHMGWKVTALHAEGDRLVGVSAACQATGEERRFDADYVFSTMPVKELVAALDAPIAPEVAEVAAGLEYRDFLTVGLLLDELKVQEAHPDGSRLIRDNWIYIQEPDVLVGRLQIFNNWSPYMVADPNTVWVGLEYFCNEGDGIWSRSDEELKRLGADELARIGLVEREHVRDAVVIRMPKAYPGYFGTYDRFETVRRYLDGFGNLFLVGRNGMHRYNNQDHSMMTAMAAVDLILAGSTDKAPLWNVNADDEYHESVQN